MKKIFTFIVTSVLLSTLCIASEEGGFIKAHIESFSEINTAAQNFERELLNIKSKDTALKYIDQYSLSIEKVLPIYSQYIQSSNSAIKEVATDQKKMLTDIMINNYELLGKLVEADFNLASLNSECDKLVKKNQYISSFLKDVSIGICAITVKDKPKDAKRNEQFSKLSIKERDEINNQLTALYSKEISKRKKENSANSFEYSCLAIYEFLNMNWKFEK